ncbi:hypothetical protein D3C73_1354760 [compost metagenome]
MRRRHYRNVGFVDVLKDEVVSERYSVGFRVQLNLRRCGKGEPIAVETAVTPVTPVLVVDKAADTVDIDPVAVYFHLDAQILRNLAPGGRASIKNRHHKAVTGLPDTRFGDHRTVRRREVAHRGNRRPSCLSVRRWQQTDASGQNDRQE